MGKIEIDLDLANWKHNVVALYCLEKDIKKRLHSKEFTKSKYLFLKEQIKGLWDVLSESRPTKDKNLENAYNNLYR